MIKGPAVQFIYTGGTIGMVDSPDGLDSGGDVRAEIAAVLARRGGHAEFGFTEFDRVIDSSNVTPEHWQQMIDHLRRHRGQYDGFVVLHGTNTLAYSAAALGYALTGFGKPVIFTGSQIPFGMPGTDAPGNVQGAFEVASAGTYTRVGLFFDGDLLSGVRATKTSALAAHGFTSPNAAPVAWRAGAATPTETQPVGAPGATPWTEPEPYRRHDVPIVTAAPGMAAARFRAITTPAPDAVIYRAYGAGEGPGDEPGLEQAIRELTGNGTPVVVTSQCVQARVDLHKYAAAAFLRRAGAVGAADMTLEAVYTKLLFLLSQGLAGAELVKWLATDIAGEMTAPPPRMQ